MLDKVLASLSIATFIVFIGIVLVWVNEPDLWIISLAVIAMAIYDFVTSLRAQTRHSDRTSETK